MQRIGKLLAWALTLCLLLSLSITAQAESGTFQYRFAGAEEAAELLLSNRAYYEGLTQNDLNFRMQKLDATLEELEAFAATQTRDFSDAEKAAIDAAMAEIEAVCRARGYALPPTDGIVFAKTTMHEECDAGAYTHGTQIYMGENILACGLVDDPAYVQYFQSIAAHEFFHCLTRNHPDFRAAMYGVLGFTVVEEDYDFAPAVRERIIANPDVEHHNSYAAFEIDGKLRDCAVVFTTDAPFREPGDNFFASMATGLVPIDELGTMYTSEDAANFWEVFGLNTGYVVDPEETLADNFSFLLIYGADAAYESPEIIEAIDALLKTANAELAAAA